MISNALHNIAESSSSSAVAGIRNESQDEALILEGIAALFQSLERKNIVPNMTFV